MDFDCFTHVMIIPVILTILFSIDNCGAQFQFHLSLVEVVTGLIYIPKLKSFILPTCYHALNFSIFCKKFDD